MKKTATEAQLRKWANYGLTHAQIAEKLGRHVANVSAAMAVLGLSRPTGQRQEERAADWHARMCRGETCSDIAGVVGCSPTYVHSTLKRAGYPTTVAAAIKAMHVRQFPGVDIDAVHRRRSTEDGSPSIPQAAA